MKRRDFLAVTGLSALGAYRASATQVEKQEPLVGVQIAPVSLLDEGIESCLDKLRDTAGVNALFIYSQTYHAGTRPKIVLAADHGIPVREFSKSRLPHLWVRHRAGAFSGSLVQHEAHQPDFEYADRDIFREVMEPARQRGMKVYARILEADASRKSRIPGYENVLAVDHEGKPAHGPCWNNPHYRGWVYTTIRELVTNYELDGLQYGAERTGPLSHVLYSGMTPGCFCEYCTQRAKRQGIDSDRARTGYTLLYQLMNSKSKREVNDGTSPDNQQTGRDLLHRSRPEHEAVLSSVMRVIYRYPEVLSWDYQWFQADEEICTEIHRIAKSTRPTIDSGRHVDHQRSSWDFFYRSATSYEQMAENADFIKPIVYHDSMGPRLRWWVLERAKENFLSDLSLEQSLQLFYGLFGHDSKQSPELNELNSRGLGPEYVYRETLRCKKAVGYNARV